MPLLNLFLFLPVEIVRNSALLTLTGVAIGSVTEFLVPSLHTLLSLTPVSLVEHSIILGFSFILRDLLTSLIVLLIWIEILRTEWRLTELLTKSIETKPLLTVWQV